MPGKDFNMSLTNEQFERYSRHIILPEIGILGQNKLMTSKVLVIGAGALGSAVLLYLAGAGVGTIGIADSDEVSLSNLQRQVIHKTSTVGTSKLESAKSAILALNPEVKVILHEGYVSPFNIEAIISGYDFIIDCTDNFETKFLINDACVINGKPFSHAGVLRFGGQLMTYVPGKGPCLRCLLGDIPSGKEVVSCSEAGILGAIAGIVGCNQALETIKFLTNTGELLTGKLLCINGLSMEYKLIHIPDPEPSCPVCGANRTINLKDNAQAYFIQPSC